MFIPLGFGSRLQVFPWAISTIAVICIGWSHIFFPSVFSAKSTIDAEMESLHFSERFKVIFSQACLVKFKNSPLCENFETTDTPYPRLQELKDLLVYVNEFKKHPNDWPAEARALPAYQELMANIQSIKDKRQQIAVENGFMTWKKAGPWALLRASFTHGGYLHLLGNLLVLILFGVWVEQRVGAVMTGVLFITGSFFGLMAQLATTPDSPVMGASAGISALMGAFFIFFFKAEFQFLFSLGIFYFKRLSLPVLWTIPVFYMSSDFIAVFATKSANSDIAHWAHLIGLVVGLSIGFIIHKFLPVKDDILFFQEIPLMNALKTSKNPNDVWEAFSQLIKWNPQNYKGIALFLERWKELDVPTSPEQTQMMMTALTPYVRYHLRRRNITEMIQALHRIPPQISISTYLGSTPVSQTLKIADKSAELKFYSLSITLYQNALARLKDSPHREDIALALEEAKRLEAAETQRTPA